MKGEKKFLKSKDFFKRARIEFKTAVATFAFGAVLMLLGLVSIASPIKINKEINAHKSEFPDQIAYVGSVHYKSDLKRIAKSAATSGALGVSAFAMMGLAMAFKRDSKKDKEKGLEIEYEELDFE